MAALRAFPKPLVLIAGGRSKGLPVAALAEVVAERATAAVLIGETADELERAFAVAGLATIERAGSMTEAVGRASRLATREAGEGAVATVLLSPAAASFDMFLDYEARGAAFKAAVATIVAETERDR
jgi:UDP-N-acetylmuramoylalanine--D-glutamate ligase